MKLFEPEDFNVNQDPKFYQVLKYLLVSVMTIVEIHRVSGENQ